MAAALGALMGIVLAVAPATALAAGDQPNWQYFPNVPFPDEGGDWDQRVVGCFPAGPGHADPCTIDERNTVAAATIAWDTIAGSPTSTTDGEYADTALSALSPIAPGPDRNFRPVSVTRDYLYPFTNQWRTSSCNPSVFSGTPSGDTNDINAATVNVFVAHNHMHDWSRGLGFTPATFNMEDADPMLGNVQAGAKTGPPTFTGRDAANLATPADGTSPSNTSYLWQPIAGAYYPRCVDGSFDMSVLAHEYAHAIANRMVGGAAAGLTSTPDGQALAIGEGFADSAAVAYLHDHGYAPADDEDAFTIGAYITGNGARGVRSYSMAASPLNYSNVQGWDGKGAGSPADDGEIWAAVNHDIREALLAAHPADGGRRWIRIAFDALLTMPANATMVQARDAYIAAAAVGDRDELWTAFARRGLGAGAASSGTDDPNPQPSFESPLRTDESTVTFAPGVEAELYVGDYEAGATPVADTDPGTARDATFEMLPGNYSFVARGDGRGTQRFERAIPAGSTVRLDVQLPVNRASAASGATIAGDGTRLADLIDDTEATNWERTGSAVPGTQVTVALGGGRQLVERVNVSARVHGNDDGDESETAGDQNRFTALRAFALRACSATAANARCTAPGSFGAPFYTSVPDAFPGAAPRPVAPDLSLRGFDVPNTTATHLRLTVLANQCTGSSLFSQESEQDPFSASDCETGNSGGVGRMDQAVRAAELQVFSRLLPPAGGGNGGPGPGAEDPAPALTRLSLKPRRFRRGRALPRAAAVRKGTTIRFRLSEPARVTYSFQRRVKRRGGGRRWKRAGTLRRSAGAGINRLRFQGRLTRRRSLKPGSHRLIVVARDPAGQRSPKRTVRFTLLPAR